MRRPLIVIVGLLAATGGCRGEVSEPMPPDPRTPPENQPAVCQGTPLPLSPAALLTRREYDNTVADLLGDTTRPASTFPPENEVQGFQNFTAAHQASPLLVEGYLDAAERLAARAIETRLEGIAPCSDGQEATACGRSFVREFGLRAFRRPLSAAEALAFDDLFGRTYVRASYAKAVELTLQAMLQSPQFLYRTDTRRSPSPESGAIALGAYELASRLSYFLTGSMPDAELFAAAGADQLSTDEEVTAQAERLLATPRARDVVRSFHHQWLGLASLPSVAREAEDVVGGAQELGADWLESFDRFIDHVYWESGSVDQLFASKRVFLSPRLAGLYGASVPEGDFTGVDLEERAGLLTQPAVLAMLAHSNQSAPVLRGVFVREHLMCLPVPPPPPTVNVVPPDPDPNATSLERFRVHTEKSECAGCHKLIDGVGFGFEAYDQLGRFRTVENGLPVDASGEVFGTADPELDGMFSGLAELSQRLGQSRRVRDCVATSWYRFALGRLETDADACSLDGVKEKFTTSGGDLDGLLLSIAQSVAFRFRPPLPEDSQ